MIKSPYIFSEIKRKSFSANTSFSCKVSFKVSPEAFHAVYMASFLIRKLTFAMFYQTANIASRRHSCISLPGIRVNHRTSPYSIPDQRQKSIGLSRASRRIGFHIGNKFNPYISITTRYTEYGLLPRSTTSFCLLSLLCFPFILPLTTNIGLIYLNSTFNYLWYISNHIFPCRIQYPEDSALVSPGLTSDFIATKPQYEVSQYLLPLSLCKSKRQSIGCPFVLALSTIIFPSSYNPIFIIITHWTSSSINSLQVLFFIPPSYTFGGWNGTSPFLIMCFFV